MNPQFRLYAALVVVTIALFGGLLYVGSKEQNKPSNTPSGAAYSRSFDENAPVMYFYSDACHFCQLQKPILDELADEGYRVKPMDVQANATYWQEFSVDGTPTFVAPDGERLRGLQEKDTLKSFLDRKASKISP